MAILKSLAQAIVATLLFSSAASALDTRAAYARPQAFRPKVARNHNGNNDGGVASLLDGLDLGNLNLGGLDNLLGLNSGSSSSGNSGKKSSSSNKASSLTAKQCVQLAADIASAAAGGNAGSNATAVANAGGNATATAILVASSHSAAITTSIVVTDAATTLSTVVATKTAAAAAKATATKAAAAKQKRHPGGGHSNAQNSKDQVAAVEDAISQCASLGIDVTKGQAKAQQQADAASSKSNGNKGHHGNDNNDNNNGNDGATIIIIDNKLKARNIWEA